MSNVAALNKSTTSSATAGTSQYTEAGRPTTIVAGESQKSVQVQSQLATSTVDGKIQTNSNLAQVVSDLGVAHSAHNGWLEAETLKITQWGENEIQRLLAQTKVSETAIVLEAQNQQKLLEEVHKADLAKRVQELDAKKAMQLKELEDALQRQIQAALNTSKTDINQVESEMNKRKMQLMSEHQLRTAKEIDGVSGLAVVAQLVPSTTRTIIETNTGTGTVIAVAGGGEIQTGSAAAQSIKTESVQAAPAPGTLVQTTDVKTGDIRRNDNNAIVGQGAIVSTMSEVAQAPHAGQPLTGAQPVHAAPIVHKEVAAPVVHKEAIERPVVPAKPILATRPIEEPARQVTVTSVSGQDPRQADAAYAKTQAPSVLVKLDQPAATATGPHGVVSTHQNDYAKNEKHLDHTTADHTDAHGKHHKEGLLSKIKHAIKGEPKTSDASANRL